MNKNYLNLCNAFYHQYFRLWQNTAIRQYAIYSVHIVNSYFPKLAYDSPYEKEYTKFTVRNNLAICSGIFLVTVYLANK